MFHCSVLCISTCRENFETMRHKKQSNASYDIHVKKLREIKRKHFETEKCTVYSIKISKANFIIVVLYLPFNTLKTIQSLIKLPLLEKVLFNKKNYMVQSFQNGTARNGMKPVTKNTYFDKSPSLNRKSMCQSFQPLNRQNCD